MSARRGLGKGLDALIPTGDEKTAQEGGVLQVPIKRIIPNPRQPRVVFEESSLQDLANSIAAHGILQPLIVTQAENEDQYQLIAGERRLQAAGLIGKETVPVIIRQADEQQQLEWALIENLQRADLNPLETAEGYRQLIDDFGLSHDSLSERVGKSRTAVTNTLRLLKLPKSVLTALRQELISEGHARALLGLSSAQAQSAALQTILNSSLNVRQTEDLVRRLTGKRRPAKAAAADRSPDEVALEEQLRQTLGTRVSLKRGASGGSIVIQFFSDEELNALVERLLGDPDS
jgi:ParB family transcriptional regulator, chromosome partitioning protein